MIFPIEVWAAIMWSTAWTGIMFLVWADSPITEPKFLDNFRTILITLTWLAGLLAINFTTASVL